MSSVLRAEAPADGQVAPTDWQVWLVVSDAVQLFIAGLVLDFVLFSGTQIGWLLRVSAIGVLLFAASRSHAWLWLMAIQTSLLVREPSRASMPEGWEAFGVPLAALGLVAYASSFHLTRRHWCYFWAPKLQRLFAPHAKAGAAQPASAARSESESHDAASHDAASLGLPKRLGTLLALRGLMLVVVVLLSTLAFTQLPVSYVVRQQWWQRSVRSDLTLWPGPTVFLLAFALAVLFWQSEWRQLTPAQARLVLRSALVSSLYRDWKMIVLRESRISKKKKKKQKQKQK